jgi:ABC-type nitrate/sulfonate/bicarbonate transport system substrate-binding protein
MKRSLSMLLVLVVLGAPVYWFGMRSPAPVASPRETLVLGFATVPHSLPAMVAQEQGFFRDEGLDVTVKSYASGKAAVAAVLAKEVDIALAADTPIAVTSANNKNLVVLATIMHTYADSKIVVANPAIHTPHDLRGRRVGVMVGTNTQRFLHALIGSSGMRVNEIVEVPIQTSQAASMLDRGELDAVAIFEPFVAQLSQGGTPARTIMSSGRTWTSYNYAAERALVQGRNGAVVRLLRATDRAIAWSRLHRPQVIALMARRFGINAAMSATILDEFTYALSLDQTLLLSLEEHAEWAMQAGLLAKGPLPNYLDAIELSAMQTVKPAAITIIR